MHVYFSYDKVWALLSPFLLSFARNSNISLTLKMRFLKVLFIWCHLAVLFLWWKSGHESCRLLWSDVGPESPSTLADHLSVLMRAGILDSHCLCPWPGSGMGFEHTNLEHSESVWLWMKLFLFSCVSVIAFYLRLSVTFMSLWFFFSYLTCNIQKSFISVFNSLFFHTLHPLLSFSVWFYWVIKKIRKKTSTKRGQIQKWGKK